MVKFDKNKSIGDNQSVRERNEDKPRGKVTNNIKRVN